MQELQNFSTHPQLLRLNRERIEMSYLVGVREDMDGTTVLLLDPSDPTARQLLEMMGVTARVDAVAAEKAKQGVTTYISVPVTSDWAGRVFMDLGIYGVQQSLSTVGGDMFGAIIVADGAVSVVGLSKPVD